MPSVRVKQQRVLRELADAAHAIAMTFDLELFCLVLHLPGKPIFCIHVLIPVRASPSFFGALLSILQGLSAFP